MINVDNSNLFNKIKIHLIMVGDKLILFFYCLMCRHNDRNPVEL